MATTDIQDRAFCDMDDRAAEIRLTDAAEARCFSRKSEQAYAAIQALKVAIYSLQAEDLTDAAMQLAIVHADIDMLRSPGSEEDAENLADRMERAVWSALSVVVRTGKVKFEGTAIDRFVYLDRNPFPVIAGAGA